MPTTRLSSGSLSAERKVEVGSRFRKTDYIDPLNRRVEVEIKLSDTSQEWSVVLRTSKADRRVKPTCSVCEGGFESTQDVERHSKVAHGHRYMCTACDKGFKRARFYTAHMLNTHSLDKPFRCEMCWEKFATVKYLKNHMANSHCPIKACTCDECGKTFRNKSSLVTHLRTKTTSQLMCPICGKFCNSLYGLKRHVRSHDGQQPHVCAECGAKFARYQALLAHQNKHKDIRPFKCYLCTKQYHSEKSLISHRTNVHDGKHDIYQANKLRILPCPICGVEVSYMPSHMRVHSGTMAFKCDLCQKSFRFKHHLQNHLATTHSEERPFPCGQCDLKFKLASHLRSHMLTKHGERKAFKCPFCDETFPEYRQMMKHRKLTHVLVPSMDGVTPVSMTPLAEDVG